MSWKHHHPKFEYEETFPDFGWPWFGHKFFAYDFVRNFKPKTIVELGTHKGTSFWSFCQAVKDENFPAKLFAVDTWKGEKHAGFYGNEVFEKVKEIQEKYYKDLKINLLRKTFDEAISDFEDKSIDLLHIDGLHTYEAVKHDFENWISKVKDDGVIIFHDIFVNQNDFGVYKLWEELKKKYKTIEFYHSFGLGVLFKNAEKYQELIDREKELQMTYSFSNESKKNWEINKDLEIIQQKDSEIEQRDQIIQQKEQIIQEKEAEIAMMKSSKFWKLRERYIRYKRILKRFPFLLIKGFLVLAKYGFREFFSRLKNLYRSENENQYNKKIDFEKEIGAKKIYLSEALDNFTTVPAIQFPSLQDPIDIIIPIYNGYEYLEKLIASIFSNTTIAYRLILIDDCSPDERIRNFLENLKDQRTNKREILFLRNKKNLGFVKTVNRGMKLAKNHFVILNTDVEVPQGWLERLVFPIYNYNNIASATPFTNSGEICSFPFFLKNNEIFENLEVNEIDIFFKQVKAEKNYIDLPTGVGFCMALNKRVVDEIGIFDEENFGKGYGEENDWCQRAIRKGYKNVIVPNLFVYHKHGGSFSSEEKKRLQQENLKKLSRKHGNYLQEVSNFIARDPLKIIRDFLILLISASYQEKNNPILFIDHDLGGGANLYREEFIKREIKEKNSLLLLTYKKEEKKYCLNYFYKNYKLTFFLKKPNEIKKLLNFIKLKKIIINNVVSYPNPLDFLFLIKEIAKENKLRMEFLVHDYFCLCPNYILLGINGRFCGLPEKLEICKKCLENNQREVEIPHKNIDIIEWRKTWKDFLESVDEIICFSNSSQEILGKVYKDLPKHKKIKIKYHKVEYIKPLKDESVLKIGVLGSINYAKGLGTIREMLSIIKTKGIKAKIIIIGETSEEIKDENIIVHGKYNREELQKLVISYDIDVFCILSVIPETFSYTTEEIIKMGYPIAVFDLGAPAERVRSYKKGIIIPEIDANSVLNEILKFSKKN